MKLLFKWAKGKHRRTVRRYKSKKPSLNLFLLDCYFTVTGSILTSLTLIYFSSLGTQEHSWSRLQNKQTMMNINYGLFFSFRNISDKNREEYDLKKHQGQHIWKGNRLRVIVGKNKPRKTGWMASSTRPGRQEHEFGLRVRMPRCANLLPVAVVACPVLVS